MNCEWFAKNLDEYLEDSLGGSEPRAARMHLENCPICRRKIDRVRAMRDALRALPVPEPGADFFNEALVRARTPDRSRRLRWPQMTGVALAAGLALWLGFGWLPNAVRAPAQNSLGVTIALHEARTVHLSLNAERDLKLVMLSIRLPEGVEVQGFPGKRELRWHTDLAQGMNLLALPLVGVSVSDGTLVARLDHGDRHTEYSVRLHVHGSAGSDARTGVCSILPCLGRNSEVHHG